MLLFRQINIAILTSKVTFLQAKTWWFSGFWQGWTCEFERKHTFCLTRVSFDTTDLHIWLLNLVLIYKQNRSAALQKYYFLHFKVSGVLKGWKLSIQGLIHLLLKLNICTQQRGLDKGLFLWSKMKKKLYQSQWLLGRL